MNILIFTAGFGMGHVRAADAIKEKLIDKDNDTNVKTVDFIECISPVFSKCIYSGFENVVNKHSDMYNKMYNVFDKNNMIPFKGIITAKIENLINNFKADAVVVTIPICAYYLSELKKKKELNIPIYTVITDIDAHDAWIGEGITEYFVGSSKTKDMLIKRGINADRVVVSGVPVHKCFICAADEDASAREKNILFMGGGLGMIPDSDRLFNELSKRNDIRVTLIAGKNEMLRRKMEKKFPKIEVIGYTEHVEDYMKKADLLISKAGGITTFEAINSLTPIYVIKPFLEQEKANASYIEENSIGEVVWGERFENITRGIMRLLDDDKRFTDMRSNMKRIRCRLSDSSIANEIIA